MFRSLHMKLVLIMLLLITSLMAVVGAFLMTSVTNFYIDDFYSQMGETFGESNADFVNSPPRASSGGPHLGPSSETAQNALLGAAFCKGKLGSGNKPQPPCGLAQDTSACLVLTLT